MGEKQQNQVNISVSAQNTPHTNIKNGCLNETGGLALKQAVSQQDLFSFIKKPQKCIQLYIYMFSQ